MPPLVAAAVARGSSEGAAAISNCLCTVAGGVRMPGLLLADWAASRGIATIPVAIVHPGGWVAPPRPTLRAALAVWPSAAALLARAPPLRSMEVLDALVEAFTTAIALADASASAAAATAAATVAASSSSASAASARGFSPSLGRVGGGGGADARDADVGGRSVRDAVSSALAAIGAAPSGAYDLVLTLNVADAVADCLTPSRRSTTRRGTPSSASASSAPSASPRKVWGRSDCLTEACVCGCVCGDWCASRPIGKCLSCFDRISAPDTFGAVSPRPHTRTHAPKTRKKDPPTHSPLSSRHSVAKRPRHRGRCFGQNKLFWSKQGLCLVRGVCWCVSVGMWRCGERPRGVWLGLQRCVGVWARVWGVCVGAHGVWRRGRGEW